MGTKFPLSAFPFASMSREAESAAIHAHALPYDPAELAAGYGRWWYEPQIKRLLLSSGVAEFLDAEAAVPLSMEACFAHVVSEDMPPVLAALARSSLPGMLVDCDFRILKAGQGLRWLRMQSLPQSLQDGRHMGVLLDITPIKSIALRERFCFEITQFLVGTHQLDEAVVKVLQLVCENLGWDWGAYWEIQHDGLTTHKLACRQYWHRSETALAPFTRESRDLQIAPGQGLVGHVWSSGEATWVDDIQHDRHFLRRRGAMECGLHSGYAFPVSYVGIDGRRVHLGVLEFFSSLSRQQDAQLPTISAAIGALIAQTVQRVKQQEAMRRLAQIDDLTGLANRSHFHQLLDAACLNAAKSGEQFGLLYIDLDRFKPINDAFGHDAGNAVLKEFAQRLLAHCQQKVGGETCHIGRLGGDEFVILQPLPRDASHLLTLQTLAEQVLEAARAAFHFETKELTVSASIGISIFSENGWTSQELLRSADEAMYRSKKAGRNAYCFFSGSGSELMAQQQTTLAHQLTMEAQLHRALADNEFQLDYQPVFDNFSGRMVAVEALIRWRRSDGELVRPDVFIPVAEKSRLIVQIGRWVVKRACRDLALFHQAGLADLKINVNMAATEFTNASLPHELMSVIDSCGISPRHVCLELTEGMVMKHPEKVIPVMHMLRQSGFHISLDDFGIGHSSLSRLKKLPITSLKIDRSFISGLPSDRGDSAIVRSILDLGRHMKLAVVAEGVETDAQLLYLAQFGCTLVQGYLLSRPMPLQALIALHHSGNSLQGSQ